MSALRVNILDDRQCGVHFNMEKIALISFDRESNGILTATVYVDGVTTPYLLAGESAEAMLKVVNK